MITDILFYLYLLASFGFPLTNALSTNDDHNQTDLCQRSMTLERIIELLKQQPCFIIEQPLSNGIRTKRDTNGGNFDIHAIQTTINDHRTMINYLVNNSINATFVAEAISSHHSKTGPILTSWRDLVDLFFLCLVIGFLLYLAVCRTGCAPCDKVLECLFKPIVQRIEQKEKGKQTKPSTTIDIDLTPQNKQPPALHSSISEDFLRYNTGYLTE